MKILLTGGAGFIGHHLTQQLLALGHSVIAIDNLSTGSLENVKNFQNHPHYNFYNGCATSKDQMEPLVRNSDVIFNLAASVGVQNIFKNPIECMENNIDIAKNILNLSTQYQKRLFMFSTSEVYGKQHKIPFTEEDDSIFGSFKSLRWGYAASKLIDDYMSRAHFENFKTPVTTVRLFNTIGIKQVGHYGMVVPRFFEQALAGNPLTVHGTGQQSRCFTDVRDVVAALISLIPCEASYGELINIGSPNEISILDLALKIIKMSRSTSVIEFLDYDQAFGAHFEDIQRRVPSTEKLQKLVPQSVNRGLDETLNWIYESMISDKNQAHSNAFKRELNIDL